MGTDDKIDNKLEELGGKAKEGVGRATGDEELQAQGEGDQGDESANEHAHSSSGLTDLTGGTKPPG